MQEFNGIKVGSIVTGYKVGYWKVTKITDRSHMKYEFGPVGGKNHPDPVVDLELVMDAKGNFPKKTARTDTCDISYCRLINTTVADDMYFQAVADAANIRDGLYAVLSKS